MFLRIVYHWCKPGQTKDGRAHMDEVGIRTAAAPGFLYRYRLENSEDVSLLTTLTFWSRREDFIAFRSSQTPSSHAGAAHPFERVESQEFDVTGIVGLPDVPMQAAEANTRKEN